VASPGAPPEGAVFAAVAAGAVAAGAAAPAGAAGAAVSLGAVAFSFFDLVLVLVWVLASQSLTPPWPLQAPRWDELVE
jgi:hypothetical protein